MTTVSPPMFSAHDISIHGGIIIQQVIHGSADAESSNAQAIRDALRDHIVYDAAWDSIHDFKVLPSTFEKDPGDPSFVETFEELKHWHEGAQVGTPVQIIYGPVKSGKTTLSRKLAQQATSSNLLAASFFFDRTRPGRNTHEFLIPTLAFQLSITIPNFRPHLLRALRTTPDVLGHSLLTQFRILLLEPLQAMNDSSPTTAQPMLMVLDGLDQCEPQEARQAILNTIIHYSPVLRQHFRFLITVDEGVFLSDLPGYEVDLKTPGSVVGVHKLGWPRGDAAIILSTASTVIFFFFEIVDSQSGVLGTVEAA